MSRRHVPVWTLLGVILVAALLIGSGAFSSAPPTAAQRAAAIESVIRCPSCEDLSVAVSSAPTAITVRATVSRLVDQGQSDRQIKDYLVARYGSAIVLDPPASGWSALVWILPIVVAIAGIAVLVVVLVRRRKGDRDLDADIRGESVDPAVVEERRRFLTQSLADADAEYLAGDLSDVDYVSLRQRDLTRLGLLETGSGRAAGDLNQATLATLDAPGAAVGTDGSTDPADGPATARRRRNRWFLLAALVSFAAALIVAVPVFSSVRLPGQTATGSVSLSPSQQLSRSLDQAAAIENAGQLGQAAQLYQSILSAHPDNAVALAQLGWLEYRIGTAGSSTSLIADARTKLDQAVALAPGDYAAHLYLGTVLLSHDGDAAGAADQFRLFVAAGPPARVLAEAAPTLRTAFTQAGQPLPAGVPAG